VNSNNKHKRNMDKLKVIISGGGTGGHIFPAISIANAIKELVPQADILFVGAKGRNYSFDRSWNRCKQLCAVGVFNGFVNVTCSRKIS
jgi:cysteine synthase